MDTTQPFEAVCECGEIFLADTLDDVHDVHDDGTPCGGSVVREWVDET